jgi:heme/copper-type cytochrome/quinol oxidase subunit 1
VFSRKAIFGSLVMMAAAVCIAFIGMSDWPRHMFSIGMGSAANTFFVISAIVIAVPGTRTAYQSFVDVLAALNHLDELILR